MAFDLRIPRTPAQPLNVQLEIGEILFVLGANGRGKSALMFALHRENIANARRITAHRQTWLESSLSMSPQERENIGQQILGQDHNPDSRWKEIYSAQRPGIAVHDLINVENVRA